MHKLLRKLLVVALVAFPVVATAAPWCLQRDGVESCRYRSAENCYVDSNKLGGFCMPNPRELGIAGTGPYCVVTEGRRDCTYALRGLCLREARLQNGGCVRNTERDLKRRAAGARRAESSGCIEDASGGCQSEFGGFSADGGLESAGYGDF